MPTKENLITYGYKIVRTNGEYIVYSSFNNPNYLGVGFSEEEAWIDACNNWKYGVLQPSTIG